MEHRRVRLHDVDAVNSEKRRADGYRGGGLAGGGAVPGGNHPDADGLLAVG